MATWTSKEDGMTRNGCKLLLNLLVLFSLSVPAFAADSAKESAYDRVMRTGTLRCGYIAWPPYFSLDPNTRVLSGISKDLSDSAANILGLKIEYVDVANGQQVEDFKSGKIDAMCGDGPWVLSTIKYVDYTKPYFYVPVYAYGRSDEKRFRVPENLNDPTVTFTAIDGDLSTDLAMTNFPRAKLASLGNVSDPSQMLMNVMTNKADVVIIDPVTVQTFAKSNPGKVKTLFKSPIAVYGGGFSVSKGETNLLNTLNGVVDAVINTGQMDRALKKYDPNGNLFLAISKPYRNPQ